MHTEREETKKEEMEEGTRRMRRRKKHAAKELERLDACSQFVDRAEKRFRNAEEDVVKAQGMEAAPSEPLRVSCGKQLRFHNLVFQRGRISAIKTPFSFPLTRLLPSNATPTPHHATLPARFLLLSSLPLPSLLPSPREGVECHGLSHWLEQKTRFTKLRR